MPRSTGSPVAVVVLALALPLVGCSQSNKTSAHAAPPAVTEPPRAAGGMDTLGFAHIQHLVVIYLENRSFDNLYGEFRGADGLASASATDSQRDSSGRIYAELPPIPGSLFPAGMPNRPFSIEAFVPADRSTPDLVHRFYQEQAQIDGGRMDRFAVVSDARGLVMGYYHTDSLPLASVAHTYTLCDRFFHASFGGSFLNHMWLVAAASPRFPDPPASAVARIDTLGNLVHDGFVTPDGFAVNTCYSVNSPHPAGVARNRLLPSLTLPTIGDRLSDRGISWAWYAGGWDDAVAGHADSLFQFHHQPFVYFARYADGTSDRGEHLKDERDLLAAIDSGRLPEVSFVKPNGINNEHPGYTDLMSGERHVADLIARIQGMPDWKHTAIIVTYDENGGFWDHVPPPAVDRWGPGTRVPTLVIAPFARRHFVDHHTYDTTSILALIEHRWGLAPLGSRDSMASDMRAAFDFQWEDSPRPSDSR